MRKPSVKIVEKKKKADDKYLDAQTALNLLNTLVPVGLEFSRATFYRRLIDHRILSSGVKELESGVKKVKRSVIVAFADSL